MKCSIADQLNARIEELKRDDPEKAEFIERELSGLPASISQDAR